MTTTQAGFTRFTGSRVHRVEDGRLLRGRGTFVDDVERPRMLHACFVRSDVARGRIVDIDVSEALALPGVHAVFVAGDLNPGVHEQWHSQLGPDGPETPRPPLAEGEVRFVGDPVALVVAGDRYIAEDACELVMVDIDPLPPVVDHLTAADADELVHESHGTNVVHDDGAPAAMLDEVFSAAAQLVEESVHQQAYAAVPIETRGLVVEYEPGVGEITMWVATQSPHEHRAFCARLLGMPEHRVRAIARDTGGGFGQKIFVQREEMAVMLAATKVPGALKWIEDRRENLLAAGWSRHESADLTMAFDEHGVVQGVHIDFVSDAGAYPTPWPAMPAMSVGAIFPGPYRVPAAGFRLRSVYTNTAGRSGYRGPWQYETLAREVVLDIAARQLGIDPVELRRRNLLRHDEMPYKNPVGMRYDNVSPLETFEQAVEILGYESFRVEQARALEAGRYLGVGFSNYVEPTTPVFGIFATEAATIRIEPTGKVNVYVAGGSSGNSLETAVVQLTADALGVDITDVNTIQGDTALSGFGGGTGGSRSGAMLAGAIGETAAVLRERITAIAAHRFEASEADIELSQGWAHVRGTPTMTMSLSEIAHLAYFSPNALPDGVPPGLEASGRFSPKARSNWANATHVCTCEVDLVTGQVELLRYIVSEDCGPMINPNVVEGQIAGGTVQGIGGALLEHMAYDAEGNPLSTTFMDYLLPTSTDVPEIEYGHLETPGPMPGGYKGVGEGGAIGAPPAVVNAVNDALSPLGVTLTHLPLTPDRLVDAIERSRAVP
ncbi:MAG: xanthine dehydrogenase family protein [Acidimicrobiales bacterium]|nr:xanthine dehydrogenase family protein [Acidimicrobiales bacterium]